LDRRGVGVTLVSSQSTDRNRSGQARSPQTFPDDASLAFTRKQVLQGDATHRCGKHRVVPARHINGENPGGFITDNSGGLLTENYGDGNLKVGTPQMKLFRDDPSGNIEKECGALW
jgi:hypothetical protein